MGYDLNSERHSTYSLLTTDALHVVSARSGNRGASPIHSRGNQRVHGQLRCRTDEPQRRGRPHTHPLRSETNHGPREFHQHRQKRNCPTHPQRVPKRTKDRTVGRLVLEQHVLCHLDSAGVAGYTEAVRRKSTRVDVRCLDSICRGRCLLSIPHLDIVKM